MSGYKFVDCIFEKRKGVATLTLNRPEVLNALSLGIREGIIQAVKETDEDDEIKVLIITGTGRGFCSGADVRTDGPPPRAAEGRKGLKGPMSLPVARLFALDKPTIAAVNGVAVGAGLGITLACDIRIAAKTARFGSLFVKRGLAVEWGVSWLLPRVVGMSKALKMMWTGALIDSQEAERLGIVESVVEDDKLMETAEKFAFQLAKGPSVSIELIKRLAYASWQNTFPIHLSCEMQGAWDASKTEDYKEGRLSFREKRDPVFRGF